MTPDSRDLERIRAYAEGRLSDGERAEFERALTGDPELAELTEAYGLAVEATADEEPVSATTYSDLPFERAPRRARTRRLLAAAAILLVTFGVLYAWARLEPQRVTLHAVGLRTADPGKELQIEAVGALARHRTADENGLVWLRDLEVGGLVARFVDRPLLLFIDHPTCPICRKYEQGPFRDERVARAASQFVLVRLSYDKAPPELMRDPAKGWPLFRALDHRREELAGFSGYKTAPELAYWLDTCAGDLRETGRFAPPDLEPMQRLARLLAQADAESALGARLALLSEVARSDPQGPFGDIARAGRDRLASDAWSVIRQARVDALAGEIDTALRGLQQAAEAHAGTPFEDDLRRVAAHIEDHSVFPRLEVKR